MACGRTNQFPALIHEDDLLGCTVFAGFIPNVVQRDEDAHWQHFLRQLRNIKHDIFIVEIHVCGLIERSCRTGNIPSKNRAESLRCRARVFQLLMKVSEDGHFSVMTGTFGVRQAVIIRRDIEAFIGPHQCLIEDLTFLIRDVRNEQREERMKVLNFGGEDRV